MPKKGCITQLTRNVSPSFHSGAEVRLFQNVEKEASKIFMFLSLTHHSLPPH